MNGDGNFHFLSEAEAINRDLAISLNRDVEIEAKSLAPDGSLEVALGNRWFFGEDDSWEFGTLGLVSYDNTWRNRERVERDVADPTTSSRTKHRTINQVSATGVVNLGLNFTSDHEITTSSFYLRNTEDESSISTRTNNNFQIAQRPATPRLRHSLRGARARANQVRGHHVIGRDTRQNLQLLDQDWLDGLTFDWYVSDATADTDIPNEIKFSAEDRVDPTTGDVLQTAIRQSTSAADYRFTYLQDEVDSTGWDLMKPYVFENSMSRSAAAKTSPTRRAATRRRNSGSARRRLPPRRSSSARRRTCSRMRTSSTR